MPTGESFPELVRVMQKLLAPGGCPWDREQTLETLKPYLVEETYEVLDALESGDADDHREELGDLLLQIVFQAELRRAEGKFDVDDVVRAIVDKLVRRHPHVFADATAATAGDVLKQWQEIKGEEKKDRRTLDGVPRAMPALARAWRLTERASHVGFDWPDWRGARDKVGEELAELDQAIGSGDPHAIESELGDLLFAAVNLARKLGHDSETALRKTVDRFVSRFEHVENRLQAAGKTPKQATLAEMDALWDEAKASEKT